MFAIPKPNQPGEFRVCFDLRFLNSHLVVPKFKLDSLSLALQSVTKGAFFSKTDLRSGFSHVKVAKRFRKYLGFTLFGTYFVYRVLPFGLKSSPYFFCKMLAPAILACRKRGIKIFVYVDDILIVSTSQRACKEETSFLRSLLDRLGWVVRLDKSTETPSSKVVFLGFMIDSQTMTLTLPPRKAHNLTHELRRFCLKAASRKFPRRVVARICGLVNSVAQALPLAHALSRRLLTDLNNAQGPWTSSMTVSAPAIDDLLLLAEFLSNLKPVPLHPPMPTHHFRSDACLEGWGSFCVTTQRRARGLWQALPSDSPRSINMLEMMAALETLRAFQPPPGSVVLLEMDNTTAVYYLTRFAGRVPSLFFVAREVMEWCQANQVLLLPRYLPGHLNTEADFESRAMSDWEVSQDAFLRICSLLQSDPMVDRFATPLNSKLPRFNTRFFHPLAEAPNALAQSWSREVNYWAPPLPLLQRTISKIVQEKAKGILLTPDWAGRWLPDVLQNAESVVAIPLNAVRSTGSPFELTSSRLLAWKFSERSFSRTSTQGTETWWFRLSTSDPWALCSKH